MGSNLREIYKETAAILDLEEEDIRRVVEHFFRYVSRRIGEKKYRNLETLEGVKTNFSIPGFGKLVVKNKLKRKLISDGKSKDKE